MKTDANWFARFGGFLGLGAAFFVASCGGGNAPTINSGASTEAPAISGSQNTTVTVTSEADIAGLPLEQQKLLADPGWKQPYIERYEGVESLPVPSYEELMEMTRQRLENDEVILPRGWESTAPGSKSASYVGQGSAFYNNVSPPYGGANNVPNDDGSTTITKASYFQFTTGQTPTYGCNADGSNQGEGGRAIEDTINGYSLSGMPNIPISYVLEGITTANYFNTGGGNGGNSRSAVYQLYSTVRNSVAANFEANPTIEFAEVTYRSDLAPYGAGPGGGVGGGGNLCYTTANTPAKSVRGNFWKAFNRNNNATPNGQATRNYNILIAPADDAQGVGSVSSDFTSTEGSQVEWQQFYFGSVHECYGGGMIVGLSSTTSACETFSQIFTTNPGFFHNPIYGTVLEKWQSMAPASDPTRPWKGVLGAPVFGPITHRGGSPTSEANRRWYAWGWYFERGFMWYVDNDQAIYPNSPDEVQVYVYTGDNTYCPGGTYEQILPNTLYLGPSASTFHVNVDVVGYSSDGTDYLIPALDVPLGRYQIPMFDNGGLQQVYVRVNANAYGGDPGPGCSYNSYIFAWRDGQVTFEPGPDATHPYMGNPAGALPSDNKQSIYVVRVQVQDNGGNVAYGDSIPFELGMPAGSTPPATPTVLVVRNDNNAFDTNYDALISDLQAIQAVNPDFLFGEEDFSAGPALVTQAKTAKVVIWYRGGPAGPIADTQLDGTPYSAAAVTSIVDIMAAPNPRPVLHISQNLGAFTNSNSWYMFGGGTWELMPPGAQASLTPVQFTQLSGLLPFPAATAPISARGGDYPVDGTPSFGGFSPPQNAAERFTNPGSSQKMPQLFLDTMLQHQLTLYGRNFDAGFTTQSGVALGWGTTEDGHFSWGNSNTGVKNYMFSLPWSNVNVLMSPAGTRADMLWNMLAWLDSTAVVAGGGGGPIGGGDFEPYIGPAQILSVTPVQFLNGGGVNSNSTAVTGINYPDTVDAAGFSTDALRTAPLADEVQTTRPGNDGTNYNDIPFQAPFYAYIHDADGNMGTDGATAPNGDESVTFGGLLLEDTGASWTRVDPGSVGYENFATHFSGAPFDELLPVSGYYVSPSGSFAGTRLAFYGNSAPDLVFDNADGPVTYEAVAHWDINSAPDYGPGNPARVDWSIWPGDGVPDQNSAGIYGTAANTSDNFWREIDVDQNVTPEYSGRANGGYNASVFNRAGSQAQGRIVTFNYGTLLSWDGDLNRNGVRGEDADKFPVRARIYTDFATYTQYLSRTWPDNVPDLGSFAEGGCYVVDQGNRVAGIRVEDDGNAANDPHTTVTYISGTTWNVNLFFRVSQSQSPFTIHFNPDYPNPATVQEITGQVTPNVTADGVKAVLNLPVTITPFTAAASRTLALRATDTTGASNWFFWPVQTLFNTPPVFTENFDAGLDTVAKWFPVGVAPNNNTNWVTYGIAGNIDYITTTAFIPNFLVTAVAPGNTIHFQQYIPTIGGTQFLRFNATPASGQWSGLSVGLNSVLRSRTFTAMAGKSYIVTYKTHGGSDPSARLGIAYSFDGGTTWTFPTTATPSNPTASNFVAGGFTPGLFPDGATYFGHGSDPTLSVLDGINGGSYTGYAGVETTNTVLLNFGAPVGPTNLRIRDWLTRSFTTTPATGTQMQICVFWAVAPSGTFLYPGPAFEDIVVQ